MGNRRGVYRVLEGRPGGKRPLEKPKRRRKDNIKMDVQEMGSSVMDWMELARDRDRLRAFVNVIMNPRGA
jgi:hypothetical protein